MGDHSSVDAGPGHQSTDDPNNPNHSKKEKAAASNSMKCPHCRQDTSPPGESEEGTNTGPEQKTVDPKTLKELKDVMNECFKHPGDPEHLKTCIEKTQINPTDLLQFFKEMKALHKISDKGKVVKVCSVFTGLTFGADDVILKKVKKKAKKVEMTTDQQECDIIIVFCPITSRVGSDVDTAMRKMTGNKPVLLVVMHHTRDVNYPPGTRRWCESYENVVLDVHVLFHETQPGLLRCPRNDQAVREIREQLKKHSKFRWNRQI